MACSALGKVSRIGNGCLLVQTTYKHPALGLGPVLLDVFGATFQVREETKLMFQDAVNVVLTVPQTIGFHVVPSKYTLSQEPVEGMVYVDGDEISVNIVGFSPGGFVFECNQYLETRLPAKFMVRGSLKDHMVEGDYVFERMGSDCLTCGVSIKTTDRIQVALWQSTVRDLAA